ncbi:unnamed protein product [Symbiodinium sp. KB8]|nr:unnamed protein product [Symbiodinium sp. KB8]
MGVYLGVPVTGPAAQEQHVLHRSGADAWLDSVMEDEAENVPAPPPLPRDAPESAPGVSEPVDWAELRREQRRTAKTWVATVPGPRLANLNDTSGPLQELLSKFLYISSDKWEQQQRLHAMQSGDRSYAVLELASGSDVSKAVEETLRKCLEAIPAVPSALVDIPLKIQRFCAMSCGASALHALLRLPAQGMPYQFFKLLKERRVGELLDERQWPKCMLDSLARAMLVKFPTAAALKSDECQAIAEVLSMMFDSDISDIECRHAQTRDHSKVRARGWVPSLETLAAKFALRGSNHARYNPEPGSRSWKTRTPKKKKGGGGAWRAFVQQHAEGVRSAAELAVKYRHLSRAERSRLELAGKIATAAHRQGHSSFGVRQRAPRKASGVALVPGLLHAEAMVAEDEQPMSMLEAERRDLNLYDGPTFAERYATWKQEQQQVMAASNQDPERDGELAKFALDLQPLPPLASHAAQHERHQPGLVSSEHFARFPCVLGKLNAFEWMPNLSRMVQETLGRQNVALKRRLKVVQTLLSDWTQKCEIYFHDDQEPVVEDQCRFFRPSPCFLNGCCSCDSKQSVNFQSKLSKYLRSVFSKKDGVVPKERLLLDRRLVFLAFQTQDARSSAATVNKAEIFMHVAYVNLTSWRFTGLKMHPVRWSEDGCVTLQIIADSSTAADASLQVQTDMELCLRSLNLSTGCEVSLYVLSDKTSHWEPQQGVNLVPVVALPDFSFQWMNDDGPGPSRRGGRGEKRQRNDEDMDELELAQRLLHPGPRAAQTKSAPKRGASDQAAGEQPSQDDDRLDRESVAASEALDSQGSAASAISWLEELDKASESASDASSTDGSDVIAELCPVEGAKQAGEAAPVGAREAGEAVPADANANQAGEAAAAGEGVAAARRAAALRDRTGTQTLRIGSLGELRFLPQSSQFVAVCEHPAHGDCRRARTAIGSSSDRLNTAMQRGQGRPLGMLTAWLQAQHAHESQQSHCHGFAASLEVRRSARDYMLTLPGGSDFSQRFERPCRPDEPAEPAAIR